MSRVSTNQVGLITLFFGATLRALYFNISHRFFTLPVSFCGAKLQQKNDIRKCVCHFSAFLYVLCPSVSETVFVLVAVNEGKAVFAEAVEADEEHHPSNSM
ncbi:MAG: hypothetical protein IJP45_08600 [Paludibacteraceae bacterium]|nr:hypothetical protein [Paludibacteraceae bacterium]